MCDHVYNLELKKFQRAIDYPFIPTNRTVSPKIPIQHHRTIASLQTTKLNQCTICILWNILDTIIYALLPFTLIFICSIIIIVKICQRRRSTLQFGGTCHRNRRIVRVQDNLSILLIAINFLFLIMTGPFNVYLIVQSIGKYCAKSPIPVRQLHQFNLYLRLLQNSYHALSFIFYCVIGNKFRHSAWVICQRTRQKAFAMIDGHVSHQGKYCCLRTKDSRSGSQTLTTVIALNSRSRNRCHSMPIQSNLKPNSLGPPSPRSSGDKLNTIV